MFILGQIQKGTPKTHVYLNKVSESETSSFSAESQVLLHVHNT
jgi:hypothetical protein